MDAVEYLRTYHRMCNAIVRENDDACKECPLSNRNNGKYCDCVKFVIQYPEECVGLVEKWAEDHKIITNADKFKEVFGIDKPLMGKLTSVCYKPDGVDFMYEEWWNKEYVEPEKFLNGGTDV